MARCPMLLLLLAATASAWEAEVDTALLQDDQCVSNANGDCVVNALQMRSKKSSDEQLEGDEADSDWLQDITAKTKDQFKELLTPLQKPIVYQYQDLSVLERFVNYTIEKVENATGAELVWDKKLGLLQEDEQESDTLSMGRRRSSASKSLPPRARYVNAILIYLEKEMKAVWNLHTIVDRKRWGVGNVITSNPYGPHGEHPDEWKPNGSFPMPLLEPPMKGKLGEMPLPRVKANEYENKYAQQLEEDYEALVANIIDAQAKITSLREALKKMDGFADEFDNSTSGVFNRIETQ